LIFLEKKVVFKEGYYKQKSKYNERFWRIDFFEIDIYFYNKLEAVLKFRQPLLFFI